EVKRNLIKEITNAVEKAYKIPKEHIIVVIKENVPENVGIGGILISDRRRM
ncbi:MAG: 4-oxalocrotonate tautomerase family protein, partial [Promethearchaeota archaeon]